MSTVEMQIAARASTYSEEPLTNLHMFIDRPLLEEVFACLNKRSASGVDGQTWHSYNEQSSERLNRLLAAFKGGSYRAPAIRRVYIPKGDGGKRPLGLPTVEDKILQTAVSRILTPVYEQLFDDGSYGFRPGKSAHQGLEELYRQVSFQGKRYVIDADMANYFGSIDHRWLRVFLDRRIKDRVTRRMIDKWLKAGVLDEGQLSYPERGTPQGGSISPLLANIYLHYVLDEWFIQQIQPQLKGSSSLIRFADDFLLLFSNKEDAGRVMKVLPKRLGKYGLTLHPEKTKLVDLTTGRSEKPGTFDFLGFTHYMGKSRKGACILKRHTRSKKLKASLVAINDWLKRNRHRPVKELIEGLNQKLRGHYAYYGITFNIRKLYLFYEQVKRLLVKWLNRRGGKASTTWVRFGEMNNEWMSLERPRIVHSYCLAKP